MSSCVSGGNAFTIDLWGKDSDPLLPALQFFAAVGVMICAQLAKLFLAERMPLLETNLFQTNVALKEELQTPTYANVSGVLKPFQSDIGNVYLIFGAITIVGTVLLVLAWLYSGCEFRHWKQDTEGEAYNASLQSSLVHTPTKLYLFASSLFLCVIAFLGLAEENFASLSITFAINTLGWSKNDAGNFAILFWASLVVSRCVSVPLAKIIQVDKINIICSSVCFGSTLLMTLMLKVTHFALWIGASLLGLGIGTIFANTLNAGKRLTSQTGIIASFILASGYTGKMVAPLVVGYLMDHVDPLWFLYLGVMYCGGTFVLSVVFQSVKLCSREVPDPGDRECDVPLQKTQKPLN